MQNRSIGHQRDALIVWGTPASILKAALPELGIDGLENPCHCDRRERERLGIDARMDDLLERKAASEGLARNAGSSKARLGTHLELGRDRPGPLEYECCGYRHGPKRPNRLQLVLPAFESRTKKTRGA